MSDSNGKWTPQSFSVVLPRELEAFIHEQVAAGVFADPSHLVAEALYSFRDVVALHKVKHAELRAAIQEGIDELDRGEGIDGVTVFARLRAKLGVAEGQLS